MSSTGYGYKTYINPKVIDWVKNKFKQEFGDNEDFSDLDNPTDDMYEYLLSDYNAENEPIGKEYVVIDDSGNTVEDTIYPDKGSAEQKVNELYREISNNPTGIANPADYIGKVTIEKDTDNDGDMDTKVTEYK